MLSERGSSLVLHDRSFLALACKACYSETAFYRTGRVRPFSERAYFLLEAGIKCIWEFPFHWTIEQRPSLHHNILSQTRLGLTFEKKFMASVVRPR